MFDINSIAMEVFVNFHTFATSLWWFLTIAVSAIALFVFVIKFKRKINNDSQERILYLERNGKYIKNLYTELNEEKEALRYFLFKNKRLIKLVRDFNLMFNNSYGRNLNKYLDIEFKIDLQTGCDSIKKRLNKFYDILEGKEHSDAFFKGKGDLDFYVTHESRDIRKKLKLIAEFCDMVESTAVLIAAPAGNGKTNLLCSFAETAINTGSPCIFIEAKQIRGNCLEYLKNRLHIPCFISTWLSFNIISIILKIFRKNLYVVIDAINENDTSDFVNTLYDLDACLQKYKNFNVLYSCRTEFISERMEKLFGDRCYRLYTKNININEGYRYNKAYEHMFLKYSHFFGFKGVVSAPVKLRLYSSLVLMRIFFEVYKDTNANLLELHSAPLFTKYISQNSQDGPHIFNRVLSKIILSMIKENSFDSIEIDKLELQPEDGDYLNKLIDNSLIINKTITSMQGSLTEQIISVITFPFDEIRDYCIARYCIIECEKNDRYLSLYNLIQKMNKEKLSPLEGVLKFSYLDLRDKSKNEHCEYILKHYGMYGGFSPNKSNYMRFQNIGFSILLNCLSDLKDFEKRYIFSVSSKYGYDFMLFISYLLDNEINSIYPGIELLYNIFPEKDFEIHIKNRFIVWMPDINEKCHILVKMHKSGEKKLSNGVISFLNILRNFYERIEH